MSGLMDRMDHGNTRCESSRRSFQCRPIRTSFWLQFELRCTKGDGFAKDMVDADLESVAKTLLSEENLVAMDRDDDGSRVSRAEDFVAGFCDADNRDSGACHDFGFGLGWNSTPLILTRCGQSSTRIEMSRMHHFDRSPEMTLMRILQAVSASVIRTLCGLWRYLLPTSPYHFSDSLPLIPMSVISTYALDPLMVLKSRPENRFSIDCDPASNMPVSMTDSVEYQMSKFGVTSVILVSEYPE